MPPASASAVRQRIRQASTPVYVAVLPAAALREAGDDPNRLARAIAAALGPATVAVAAETRTGAGSNTLDPDGTAAAIRAASSAHHDNLQATMVDFVNRVGVVGGLGGRGGEAATPVWDRPLVRLIPFVLGALILAPWWVWILLNVLRRRRSGRGAAVLPAARQGRSSLELVARWGRVRPVADVPGVSGPVRPEDGGLTPAARRADAGLAFRPKAGLRS